MEPTTVQRAGIEILAHAQFSAQVVEHLSTTPHIELLITDHTDAAFVERLTHDFPGLPVLILATHPTIHAAVRLMAAGALSYLPVQDISVDTLRDAAQQAHHHRAQYSARQNQLQQAFALLQAAIDDHTHSDDANTASAHHAFTAGSTTHALSAPAGDDPARLDVRGVELDAQMQEVTYRNLHVELSPTEFDILHTLMLASGQLVSFVDLARAVHGTDVDQSQARSLLSAHISNLRNKLRDVGCDNYIINRRGRGYFIDTDVESALERGGNELRLILEASNDIILQADSDTTIEYMSQSMQHMLGYAPDQFIGTSIEDWYPIVHPNDTHAIDELLEHVARGERYETTYRVQHADGHYIWLENVANPTFVNDSPVGMVMVLRDVTERIQTLEELAERYRILADHMTDLVSMHDLDGSFTYLSPSSERLLGYTPDELNGVDVYSLLHPKDVANFRERAHLPAVKGHRIAKHICRMQRKGGDYIWIETDLKPMLGTDNRPLYLVATSRDMTYVGQVQPRPTPPTQQRARQPESPPPDAPSIHHATNEV